MGRGLQVVQQVTCHLQIRLQGLLLCEQRDGLANNCDSCGESRFKCSPYRAAATHSQIAPHDRKARRSSSDRPPDAQLRQVFIANRRSS